MGLPKVLSYILLPFKLIQAIFMNLYMTFSQLFIPKGKDGFHKGLVDLVDVKKENQYLTCLLQGGVGDLKYFWPRMKVFLESALSELTATAEENGKAPNTRVINLIDKTEYRLLDFARAGRPLIVNFGSCTCHGRLLELADFVMIYIAEAHPTDGWAIDGNIEVANHRNLEERFAAAQRMLELEHQSCPVLVDPLTDETSKAYGGMPERLYIILDGVIVYKGGPGPFSYKLPEVEEWLQKFKGE
ncbi:type I iodothyronine deiodinase-like [Palaemon carinicauda]|uniref:type I iodothyronine deiodinase-like n=1 Tax=Palaemon carinicauda TaxID=392227 RepID=UPI0035B5E00E